ncbi:non sense mediated decay [Hyphodiscus hymeniophilus]|uniref:Non sense mediated decay n=1 Tax=Hyphodiscus hymeniophilus TaxID=353542 RepID=A0A9P7B062_9HELO|nr:non sense mediated decay [Hyphodiscus hymeniophilus]
MITRTPRQVLSRATRCPQFQQLCSNLRDTRQSTAFVLRKQCRLYSTPSPSGPPPQPTRPSDLRSQFQPISQPPTPKPKRSLRRYIYATLFLMIGITGGSYTNMIIAPPPLPSPGSKEDILMVEYLRNQAEKLPIVQSLSSDPDWEANEAYQHSAPEDRPHRITTGPLSGARAIGGFQRIFHNRESGEVVTVVWFGGAISGWPGVTHGGLIATLMDETLGRCAILRLPSNTGVTANLNLNYLKPAVTNSFYVMRAMPEMEGATDQKQWVYGRLETLDGRVCVEGRGLFVVPKKFKTKSLLKY